MSRRYKTQFTIYSSRKFSKTTFWCNRPCFRLNCQLNAGLVKAPAREQSKDLVRAFREGSQSDRFKVVSSFEGKQNLELLSATLRMLVAVERSI